jgi:hypothetical protein
MEKDYRAETSEHAKTATFSYKHRHKIALARE